MSRPPKTVTCDKIIGIRLTREEYSELSEKAAKVGCPVSTFVRMLIAKKDSAIKQSEQKKSGADKDSISKKRTQILTELSRIASSFETISTLRRSDGEPAVNEESFRRRSEDVMMLQQEIIALFGGKPSRKNKGAEKEKTLSPVKEGGEGRLFVATVSGAVSSRVRYYENNCYFSVTVNIPIQEKKYSYTVDVVIPKGRLPKDMKQGTIITVSGKLLIELDNKQLFQQLKITLFAE